MSTSTADRELVRRLESWGRAYAMDREPPSDDAVSLEDWQTERIVRRFERIAAGRSGVSLRAYFCAAGRRDRERFRRAADECLGRGFGVLSKRQYYDGVRGGVTYVRNSLVLA